MAACPLCDSSAAKVVWRDPRLRVILVDDVDHPAFCRVVWQAHIKEMTDLPETDRAHCMSVVYAVEQALRESLQPDKMNIASLGNQVPHLHWHVIPRFADDAHYPDPVWTLRRRPGVPHPIDCELLGRKLRERLGPTDATI